MSTTKKQVKCGKCKVALEVVTKDNGQKIGTCPKCANTDTLENVHRIVGEFMKEHAALRIHKAMADAARGSKFLKVASRVPPKRKHRFVIDL